MKKVYKSILVLFSVCILFSSCREGVDEPIRSLEFCVIDTLGDPVPNAKVEIYFSEEALNRGTDQIIETLYTNSAGIVKVALDIEIFDYYVNIEKEELNNWYTQTFVSLSSLRSVNKDTIMLNDPFEEQLTGKYKKRWQQTAYILAGNPSFPNCGNQRFHDFIRRPEVEQESRDGQLEVYDSEVCPTPGRLHRINQWRYNKANNTIIFGPANFEEIYEVAEFTGTEMTLIRRTSEDRFLIEEKYKLIE